MPTDLEADRYTPNPSAGLKLRTVTEEGDTPPSVIRDAKAAYDNIVMLIEANRERIRRCALLKGMFQGNPPYTYGSLRRSGQAWRFNVSTLEGKGLLSAACAPYYDLFASGRHYAEVMTAEGNIDEQNKWSRIMTEEWDWTLKAYREFDLRVWRMIPDFVGYGRGFLWWDDVLDWRFRYVPQHMVLFPNGVEADLDDLEIFGIRRRFKPNQLWSRIRKGGTERAGWVRDACIQAIRKAAPYSSTSGSTDGDAVEAQQQFNDGDIDHHSRSATINVVYLYVREYNGKWSQFIVPEDQYATVKSTAPERHPRYLFSAINRFDNVQQILCPFLYEVLDNTWNGAWGLGKDVYAMAQAKDRVRNAQLDNLLMRMSVQVRALKASDRQKIQVVHQGAVTIWPENCEVLESKIMGDIESSIAVNMDINNMLQMNLGIYRPALQKPQGNPRTATEASLDAQQQTILGGSAVNRFYNQLDPCYAEMYRRTVDSRVGANLGKYGEMAEDYVKRCKDRGVPIKAIRNVRTVRAWRAVGNGSPFLRQQALATLGGVAGSFPEGGRISWLEDLVASVSNYTTVSRYLPEPEMAEKPTDQKAYAHIENDVLKDGGSVLWTPTQNNLIHAVTHLEGMGSCLQSLEQGNDPARVLAALEAIGAHALIHLQKMEGDEIRKEQVKVLIEQWKEFAKVADQLRSALERQAQQQAQQQEMMQRAQMIQQGQDPEIELKRAETEAKLGLAAEKTREGLRQKAEKHEQKKLLDDASTADKIRREREMHEARLAAQADKE